MSPAVHCPATYNVQVASFLDPEALLNAGLDCISTQVSVTSMKSIPAFLSAHFSSSVFQTGSTSGPSRRRESPSVGSFSIS